MQGQQDVDSAEWKESLGKETGCRWLPEKSNPAAAYATGRGRLFFPLVPFDSTSDRLPTVGWDGVCRVQWDGCDGMDWDGRGMGWDGQAGRMGWQGGLAGDGMAPHGEEWARFGWQLHVPVMYWTLITAEY